MWFIYQVTTVFVLLSPSLLFFCLPWEAASHAVARLEHLRTDYLNVFKINSDEIKYTKLRLWIEHHQEILRVSAALSAATKLTIGHMSIIAGIIIGCLGTQALREGIPKSIIFIMGVLVGCFVVCHAGQSIVDETLGVSYTAYGVSWFKCDVKIQKAVLFIIMRTQKPVRLETIPFGAFDYALYLLIVKTSYTYLTVLNQKM
ncbi:odorant receptor 85b-like [Cylas formicarius]|uniref:odorant receptor 85b-like n=1 Tax=Cylas formicarius TaxID=197179 RepID=UPI0029584995|nr:odorant receptor 85b-like [Cylas formicarius]